MSIIVLLSVSSIHFFLLCIIIYKSKTTIFSIQREITITSLIENIHKYQQKLNFKIDINGNIDLLQMCKDHYLSTN